MRAGSLTDATGLPSVVEGSGKAQTRRPVKLEVVRWSEAAKPREGTLRRRLEAEGFEVLRWRDDAGAEYQPHAHDQDESLWVIRGEITFVVGVERRTLRPGDRLLLPKGTVHTAYTGAEGCLYLIGRKRARAGVSRAT
jgi:quercetin dioxygenase-like cupin family protein